MDVSKLKAITGRKWTEAEGRVAVEAWQSSGLPMWRFARENGISPRRVDYWARLLRAKPVKQMTGRQPKKEKRSNAAPRFVPAIVTGAAVHPAIVVRLTNGIELSFREVVEAEVLGRLVNALQRSGS